MGILRPLPEDTFTIGRMEIARSYDTGIEYEIEYYNDIYIDEDTNCIYVHATVSHFPVLYYVRVFYDKTKKYHAGRWSVQLMEFIEPEDRGSDKNTFYRCFYELKETAKTPLAAHRLAMNHMRYKEIKRNYKVWYVPPQIR